MKIRPPDRLDSDAISQLYLSAVSCKAPPANKEWRET